MTGCSGDLTENSMLNVCIHRFGRRPKNRDYQLAASCKGVLIVVLQICFRNDLKIKCYGMIGPHRRIGTAKRLHNFIPWRKAAPLGGRRAASRRQISRRQHCPRIWRSFAEAQAGHGSQEGFNAVPT